MSIFDTLNAQFALWRDTPTEGWIPGREQEFATFLRDILGLDPMTIKQIFFAEFKLLGLPVGPHLQDLIRGRINQAVYNQLTRPPF